MAGPAIVPIKNPMRKISVEILFKQKYNARIVARRDMLESSKEPGRQLSAYNAAVKYELQELESGDPAAHEELRVMAEELRAAYALEFDAQPDHIQDKSASIRDPIHCSLTRNCLPVSTTCCPVRSLQVCVNGNIEQVPPSI